MHPTDGSVLVPVGKIGEPARAECGSGSVSISCGGIVIEEITHEHGILLCERIVNLANRLMVPLGCGTRKLIRVGTQVWRRQELLEELLRLRGDTAVRDGVVRELFSGQRIDDGGGSRENGVRAVQPSLGQGNRGVDLIPRAPALLRALVARKEEQSVLENRSAYRSTKLIAVKCRNRGTEERSGVERRVSKKLERRSVKTVGSRARDRGDIGGTASELCAVITAGEGKLLQCVGIRVVVRKRVERV